jgi:hypothetical protein
MSWARIGHVDCRNSESGRVLARKLLSVGDEEGSLHDHSPVINICQNSQLIQISFCNIIYIWLISDMLDYVTMTFPCPQIMGTVPVNFSWHVERSFNTKHNLPRSLVSRYLVKNVKPYHSAVRLAWIGICNISLETFLQKSSKLTFPTASAVFLLGSFFGPEDGGELFLRNLGLPPNYTALQSWRLVLLNTWMFGCTSIILSDCFVTNFRND